MAANDLVRVMFTPAEMEMLYRAFTTGILGGDQRVRQTLSVKIEAARALAYEQRANTIATTYTKVPDGKEATAA